MITKNFEPKFYAVFSHAWMYFGANFQQSVGCHLVTKECWNLYIFHFSLGGNKFWVATQEPIFLKDGLRCRNENLPAFSQGMDLYSKQISAKNLISCLRKSILKKCRSFIGGPGTCSSGWVGGLHNRMLATPKRFPRGPGTTRAWAANQKPRSQWPELWGHEFESWCLQGFFSWNITHMFFCGVSIHESVKLI